MSHATEEQRMHAMNDEIAKASTQFIYLNTDVTGVLYGHMQQALRELWNAAKIGMVVTGVKQEKSGRLRLEFSFYE